jgi:hypothetical protein
MKLVVPAHVQQVFDYLLADKRRFALGPHSDEHAESRELIAVVAEGVGGEKRLFLEEAVLAWEYYTPDAEDLPADRRRRLHWNRQHRLRLLRAFPQGTLSPEGTKLLREEERALPHTLDKVGGISGGMVASPVSSEQMAKASDADLLNLFNQLPDGTPWDYPLRRSKDWLKGGGVETSRAFCNFAKANQGRALQMVSKLLPGRHERYAAEALRGVSEADQPIAAPMIEAVHQLSTRGFSSEEFRSAAAWALANVASKNGGLDDQTCGLLESWLCSAKNGRAETAAQPQSKDGDRIRSILLEPRGRTLPNGNYPVLHALFMGYMCRGPICPDDWLGVLERHLGRAEASEIWEALAHRELTYLDRAESERANDFVARLLQREPEIVNSEGFVHFVGRAHNWLRPLLIHTCLAQWERGTWDNGHQAAAEIALLRHALVPGDSRCQETVDKILAAEDSPNDDLKRQRCGFAFLCGELWQLPRARQTATRVLLTLLPGMNAQLAEAWLSVFNRPEHLPIDAFTEQLLDGIAEYPLVLRYGKPGALVDRLKELLDDGSEDERVCRVVTKLMVECGTQVGDRRTAWAGSGGDLVDIALTLQRSPGTRSCGTDIFERLMGLDVYEVSQALGELDRRFPS